MNNHVNPRRPWIGQEGVDHLAGIKHRGDRIAQQGHSPIDLRHPERPAPGRPLLLNPLIQGIIELRCVAIGKLAVLEEDLAEKHENDHSQAAAGDQGDRSVRARPSHRTGRAG